MCYFFCSVFLSWFFKGHRVICTLSIWILLLKGKKWAPQSLCCLVEDERRLALEQFKNHKAVRYSLTRCAKAIIMLCFVTCSPLPDLRSQLPRMCGTMNEQKANLGTGLQLLATGSGCPQSDVLLHGLHQAAWLMGSHAGDYTQKKSHFITVWLVLVHSMLSSNVGDRVQSHPK